MKCQECQQLILVQDLLGGDEREQMSQHLATCAACQKFQAEVGKTSQLIRQVSVTASQPVKGAALTDKIMTRVMIPDLKKISVKQDTWLLKPFTRFGLAGVSICLIVFFIIEWQSPANVELPKGPVAGLQQVILKSQSFRKELSSKEKRKSLMISCVDPGKKQTDLACLKEKIKSIQF